MKRRLTIASLACLVLLGCAERKQEAPASCVAYLDCLAIVDPDLFDEEVAKYGDGGSCLKNADSDGCGQVCATRLEDYSGIAQCGGDGAPPPGTHGGLCLAPDGFCELGTCNREENYCYDVDDPCLGFQCGGEDRGSCTPVDGFPACSCSSGFENETFALYCCPTDGSDPQCG